MPKSFDGVSYATALRLWPEPLRILKRQLLLFDRIAIPDFELALNGSLFPDDPAFRATLEWLANNGTVYAPSLPSREELARALNHSGRDARIAEYEALSGRVEEATREVREAFRMLATFAPTMSGDRDHSGSIAEALEVYERDPSPANAERFAVATNRLLSSIRQSGSSHESILRFAEALSRVMPFFFILPTAARIIAAMLTDTGRCDAHAILYDVPQSLEARSQRAEVLHVVVNALPVPDDAVAVEQILEYRSDPEVHASRQALREWALELTYNHEGNVGEVEAKLEYLKSRHAQHMRVHHMKSTVGVFELLVTLVTRPTKFTDLVHLAFSARRQDISLLEAELVSPGRDVAYIVRSIEKFPR